MARLWLQFRLQDGKAGTEVCGLSKIDLLMFLQMFEIQIKLKKYEKRKKDYRILMYNRIEIRYCQRFGKVALVIIYKDTQK